MEKERDELGFRSRLLMWVWYGIPLFGRSTVADMYGEVIAWKRAEWEAKDWRAELSSAMFCNTGGNGMFGDCSWKACKKAGMSKKRWKLLSAKDLPEERPDRWEDMPQRKFNWQLFPTEWLEIGKESGKWHEVCLTRELDALVEGVQEKPLESLVLEWTAAKPPHVDGKTLACLLCLGWLGAKAWEKWDARDPSRKRSSFYDWGFGPTFYAKFMRAVAGCEFFDEALFSDDVVEVSEFVCKWYSKPHPVTGMLSILEPDDRMYWAYPEWIPRRLAEMHASVRSFFRMTFGTGRAGPYAADEMADEILSDIRSLRLAKGVVSE